MLDNLEISIEEVEISHFDEFINCWCVDAWWHDDSTDNQDYCGDSKNDRGAVVAHISADGEKVTYLDNFYDALDNEDNAWVIENIEGKQRELKEKYYRGH